MMQVRTSAPTLADQPVRLDLDPVDLGRVDLKRVDVDLTASAQPGASAADGLASLALGRFARLGFRAVVEPLADPDGAPECLVHLYGRHVAPTPGGGRPVDVAATVTARVRGDRASVVLDVNGLARLSGFCLMPGDGWRPLPTAGPSSTWVWVADYFA